MRLTYNYRKHMNTGKKHPCACMCEHAHTYIYTPVCSSTVLEVNATHPVSLAWPSHLSKTLPGQPLGQEKPDRTCQLLEYPWVGGGTDCGFLRSKLPHLA